MNGTTALYLLLFGLGLLLGAILSGRRGKEKECVVDLEKLAALWLEQPVEDRKEEEPTAGKADFKHERLNKFWNEVVKPHEGVFKAYLPVLRQLALTLDKYGDLPSVVQEPYRKRDEEAKQFGSDYDALAKVSLLDHTLNVAEETINVLKNISGEMWKPLGGPALVAALAHDLGKAEPLRKEVKGSGGDYRTGDHAIVSAAYLKLITPVDLPSREEILRAVRNHHGGRGGQLGDILRRADHTAREREAQKLGLNILAKQEEEEARREKSEGIADENKREWEKENQEELNELTDIDLSWLDFEELIEEVEKHVNRERGGSFRAFSMKNGYVYVMPALLSDIVLKLAEKHNVDGLEKYASVDPEKRRPLERAVVELLREKDAVALVKEGYVGGRFEVVFDDGEKTWIRKGLYLPMKAEVFSVDLAGLEKRKLKTRVIRHIKEVNPLFATD